MDTERSMRTFAKGREIRRGRLSKAMTQEEFAQAAGVGLSTLKTAERSERLWSSSLKKIASTLDVDVSEIVEVREA